MRSGLRFFLACVAAFMLCVLYAAPQTAAAQTVNQYRFTPSNGASIVPGTTPVTGFTCVEGGLFGDDCVASIALPFSYTFYNNTYAAAVVSSNGNLQFESANRDYGQNEVCFPLPQFSFLIAPYFSDLTIGGAGEGVFTSVTGSAPNRVFNIEWRASALGQPAGSLSFELRLYEGQTRFDIIYGNVPGNGFDATVGAQSGNGFGSGGAFTQYECRAGGLRNGLMLAASGVNATSNIIAGQVTDAAGNPLPGVLITLSGSLSASALTDANGQYLLEGLSPGGNYTISATQDGSTFFPASRTFASYFGNMTVNFVRTVLPAMGQILISEFRFRGSLPQGGARDEFIEIYNNTDSTFVVNTPDGSNGWTVVSSGSNGVPRVVFIIPNGTVLPPRGHYLAGNGSGYSLTAFASPDAFFAGDIPDDTGIALVRTANPEEYAANLLDAVGFSSETNSFFLESGGLMPIGANDGPYSFVRRMPNGTPQDTNINANDFVMVSTNAGSFGGSPSVLGAPGPENLASPVQRNARIKASLVDSQCSGFGPSTSACARVRSGAAVTNGQFGTLAIRRKFTNTTGQKITRLRFRIVDLTTLGNFQSGQADLRALTSNDISVTGSQGSIFINGLTLDRADVQPSGGGINSTLRAGSISFSTPLASGVPINVEFRLGVQTNGNFRFFVNVEAVTAGVDPGSGTGKAARESFRQAEKQSIRSR